MTKFSFILLTFLISLSSCEVFLKATPIPKDKESFIGLWESRSKFKLEIKSSGKANLNQIENTQEPDYNKLNIKVAGKIIKDMIVVFEDDNTLKVMDPFNYAKEYQINKYPYKDGDTTKLVLNEVEFIKQKH